MTAKKKNRTNAARTLMGVLFTALFIYAVVLLVRDNLPARAETQKTLFPEQTAGPADPSRISPAPVSAPSAEAPDSEAEPDAAIPEEPEEPAGPETTTLVIRCAGDVMCHNSQLQGAYDSASGTYGFDEMFDYVRPYLIDADVCMINVETTFPGENFSGYPSFRSPDSLCSAIAGCGTDIAAYANNHMLDAGLSGFKRSVALMRDAGMITVGGYLPGEKTYTIVETKDGVKLGIVCYVYENFEQNGRRCLNGCYIPEELEDTLNSFRYYNEGDMEEIRSTIQSCREAGADIVMAFMHWGEEYYIDPMKSQQDLAQIVADAGADFIIGSHPHVPEGIVRLTAQNGKEVPVYYSLGNFVSNQRTETMGDTKNKVHTEEGLIANVELTYDHRTGTIVFDEISAIPTWVEKYAKKGGNPDYWIIPLTDGFENNPELQASGHLSRAQQALKNISDIIGEDHVYKKAAPADPADHTVKEAGAGETELM